VPHPPIYLGGATVGAAERAARATDGMLPGTPDPEVRARYFETRKVHGLEPGRYFDHGPAPAVLVTDDPERTWQRIGPHVLHESRAYYALAAGRDRVNNAPSAVDLDGLRGSGAYQVVTPDECVSLYESLVPSQRLLLHPLVGGLDPDVGWASLQLFGDRVLPRLNRARGTVADEGRRGGR
jgi:alkanesulfonate monooxygenase SsuD/methylene tetrahydromethanopterin reductase-like flavin-dependent oxidoreductase (luciferase family)